MTPAIMTIRTILLVIAGATLAGCAAELEVREVDAKQADAAIDGVPFRLPAPHKVHLYEKGSTGYAYLSTLSTGMADTAKLFTVNFGADILADPTFGLTIAEDGTIQQLTLDSTIKVDEALGAAVAGAKEAKDALLAAEKLEQERLDRAKAADKSLLGDATSQENARLLAYEAFLKAESAIAEYAALEADPSATPTQKQVRRNEVMALQAKANALYRNARMSPPYDLTFP